MDTKVNPGFSSPRVDFGIIVSDINRAAEFYTKALGFTEAPGFDVPAEMGRKSGLTDGKAFHVRVFTLGEGDAATNVKIMSFPDAPGARADNAFIHSTLGVQYLTLYVDDTTAAVERARQHGVEPIAEGPYRLPEGFPAGVYLTCVRDPDGNIIELVGPKRQ